MDFDGAIFDLDGTLLDSTEMWLNIDLDFLSRHGFVATADYSDTIKDMGYRAAADYTVRQYNLPLDPDEVIATWNQMAYDGYANKIALKQHAHAYLLFLKQRGCRLCIASALDKKSIQLALSRNGIFDLFDAVVTLQDVSRPKQFPDIYLFAAEKLGLAPGDCVVFEDILSGIKGAKSGGFGVCGVYDKASAKDWDMIKTIADWHILCWGELLSE